MTYNTRIYNYANLHSEDKQIVQAQLLMFIRQQICRHPAKRYNTEYYYQQYSYKYSKRLFYTIS